MEDFILMIVGILYLLLVIFAVIYFIMTTSGKKNILQKKAIENEFAQPFVSIIVPTFNEQRNITKCLDSLKKLNYDNFEIIVSDGGSTDGTIELARTLVDNVIIDETLPYGWIGKNWGCHLGYKQAKGEYLLFVDADTIHTPDSLRIFVKEAVERDSALLSVFPFQIIKRWWESANPLFYFAGKLVSGGNNSVNNPNKRESFIASGQFMLFKRKDYEFIGGHESIKGSIVEDMSFARVVKVNLGRLFYIDGTKLIFTHMYPDAPKQAWTGWKKCLYPGTKLTQGRRIMGALCWYLWAMLGPVAIVVSAIFTTWPFILATSLVYVSCCLAIFIYWNPRGEHQWVTYVLLPIVTIVFCLLLGISTLELLTKKTTTWRGRKYSPNLFAGSSHEINWFLKGNTNRIGQLETDREIELDEQIILYSTVKSKSKSTHNRKVQSALEIERF